MENHSVVKKRRDRLEVINAILDIATDGVVKTRIMYRTNVNFRQFEDYITDLLDAGLVEVLETESRRIYRTTEKGKTLLSRLRETSWIFDEIEDQEPPSLPMIRKGHAAYFIRR
jgi:predicted transcriptional regulator